MHTLLDESVLPFEREPDTAGGTESWQLSRSPRAARGDSWEMLAALPGTAEDLLGAEPGAGALVSAFGAGAATGALVAALFIPALPALAFGAALGAYGGVLLTSLWVSGTAGKL